MAFRKDKGRALAWKQWVDRNRERLVAIGLPPEIYADLDHWCYFLEHASLSVRGKSHWFSLDQLDRQQMQKLFELTQTDPSPVKCDLLVARVLRGVLGIREEKDNLA